MKNILKYSFIFLICTVSHVMAQPISFHLEIVESPDCHGGQNGKLSAVVVLTNPPYHYLWSNGDTTEFALNLGFGNYSVVITDSAGNDTSATIKLKENECGMYADLIFTPNNDGINDTWSVYGTQNFAENKILVYNRWGQKVYEHSGFYDEPWDGKDLFGVPVPDNTYYYIIYQDKSDEKSIIKGSVSILR